MMASAFKKNHEKNSGKCERVLNCPKVKRSWNRAVALQGWLMKRGSEGLMLWRRRWFVLSDYCLFYYKDTQEEKLLGSLILASYEISPCTPDEKGYRKFSFKAEHANMRTYYFAAENHSLMEEWIKAMRLASLLEDNLSCEQMREEPRTYPLVSRNCGDYLLMSPNDMGIIHWRKSPEPQPLYANAPPKPKRLNDSSSPECQSDMSFKEESIDDYHKHRANQPYQYKTSLSRQSYSVNNQERLSHIKERTNTSQQDFRHNNQNSPQFSLSNPLHISKDNQSSKNVSFSFPPRPHSVDFLEYSVKSSSYLADSDCVDKNNLHCRPKSSLSAVNTNEPEAIHWSAEEYARKMRQSSMYLKPPVRYDSTPNPSNSSQTSNTNSERQLLAPKVDRHSAVPYRAERMSAGDEKLFSRSASARLFRETGDSKDDTDLVPKTISNQGVKRKSQQTLQGKDPASKAQQREESMKRLLEWKDRMLESPLKREVAPNTLRESSYSIEKKGDRTSISCSGIKMDNTREPMVKPKDVSTNPVRSLSNPKDVSTNPVRSLSNEILHEHGGNLSSPDLTFYNYPLSARGLDGGDPKYGNSVSVIQSNSPRWDGRNTNADCDTKILNEFNINTNKTETPDLHRSGVSDSGDFSDDNSYAYLKPDYCISKNIESAANENGNMNVQNLRNQLLGSPHNLHDFSKKNEIKPLQPQIAENERDEEWGIKLDESRVIKEFSYQYITSNKYNECQQSQEKSFFIQSSLKNPIKSTNQETIRTRSNILNSNKYNTLQTKDNIQALQTNIYSKHFESRNIKKQNNNIVKNSYKNQGKGTVLKKGHTLRIYRKESNISVVKDGITNSDKTEKRLVQSDSEALLYDTSSDVEDNVGYHPDRLDKLNLSSDDERDEEVAAVLSKEKLYSPPLLPSVKSPYRNSSSTENIHLPPMSNSISPMDMTTVVNDDKTSDLQINHNKNHSISSDMNSDNQEENYMPMTPRKKSNSFSKQEVVHSRSNSASHTLLIENLMASSEESPYVEMTQNRQAGSSSLINPSYNQNSSTVKNNSTNSNNMGGDSYCEIGKGKDMQYEMIYNLSVPQEPLYMEVPSVKETDHLSLNTLINENESISRYNKVDNIKENINRGNDSSRPSLPDILNTTTTTLNQGSSGRSDSSDADDEASKDLDSLDTPRHPRFSLSDTFRPASYYLGASLNDRAIITLNTEHHDSSDSDLVSPPPIPTSSPPLDELETSIDSTTANKESVISNLNSEISNVYSNGHFFNSNINDVTTLYRVNNFLRNSNSNLYEASSEESINYEKREQRLKRRPLSADILSSLQDINFIMPSSDVEIKGPPLSQQITNSSFAEHDSTTESDYVQNPKVQKNKTKKYNNSYLSSRKDIVTNEALINDCENQFKYNNNRFTHQEPLYNCNSVINTMQVESKDNISNQYENLISCRESKKNDSKVYFEKYNNKFTNEHFTDKNIVITDSKASLDSNSSTEHQNNAPYYYSDLLKVEAKSFPEYEKNRWEEHKTEDNSKMFTLLTSEKNIINPVNYSPLVESNVPKLRTTSNETARKCGSPEIYNTQFKNSSSNKLSFTNDSAVHVEYMEITQQFIDTEKVQNVFSSSIVKKAPHRTRSLEGLIDSQQGVSSASNNSLKQRSSSRLEKSASQSALRESNVLPENPADKKNNDLGNEGIWEEDTLWRESLRKVSKRHTRSLEDLDRKETSHGELSPSPKIPDNTNQTYENFCITYKSDKSFDRYATGNSDINFGEGLPANPDLKYQGDTNILETVKNEEFVKKIGITQKVVAPMKNKESSRGRNSSFEIDREKLRQWDLLSSAPAILSSNRALRHNISSTASSGIEFNKDGVLVPQKESDKADKMSTTSVDTGMTVPHEAEQGQTWSVKVSAGELLGRTHEELVLLLIQLRRERARICQSMDKCHTEIEAKACLADIDKINRIEHLQKLEELKAKLSQLEKQYEKGKPLVNLVDNMVKLGSLYQAGSPQKLEFIQRIQEERLLAEERRDWDRVRPDQQELKSKVERLYRLDKLLQEESGTLHSLQQDKGVLERAIGGLRNKLRGIHGNSAETEWYKRQQRLLERELSRVRSILALNSKKLEETVAENARLEQELVVLRQKLQVSRRTAEPGGANTAALEAELCRVQLLVGNLLRQRQELSLQVRQLTEKSNSLSRQIWHNSPDHQEGYSNSSRKQLNNGWIETDLDADVGNETVSSSSSSNNIRQHSNYISPLYVNTTDRESVSECCAYQDDLFDGSPLSARSPEFRFPQSHDEETFKQAYGLPLKEKPQEIKTVRIVKRESERRQRDRDRSGNIGIPITYTNSKRPISEDRLPNKSKNDKDSDDALELDSKANESPPTPGPRTDSVNAVWNMVRKNKIQGKLLCKSSSDKDSGGDSPQLSPVYLSETARRIVEEVAWQGMGEKRLVPKEKRRHHTMSGPSLIAPQNLYSQMGSRDDLDIERVLRPRLTTPDVVRSTLIRVDPHYTKETIDKILGAPGKIVIPERYIPESQPELTKEEQNKRSKKADAIRKMLCETTSLAPKDSDSSGFEKTTSLKKKVAEEKKNREHLLQLSQILAHQVMEKSKIVAGVNPTPLE